MDAIDPIQQMMEAAAVHHRAGRLPDAEKIYRQVLSADSNHAVAIGLLGVIAHQTGYTAEAEQLLGRAVALAPNALALLNNLGVVQMERNHLPEAAATLEQALGRNGKSVSTLANLATVYAGLWRDDDAANTFARALNISPDDPQALTGLGQLLLRQGRRDEAIGHHRRALERDPNLAIAHNNLGNALVTTDPEQAAGHFRRAIELNPRLVDAWTNLAAIFARQGMPADALPILRRAIELNPRSATGHHALSRVLMGTGRVSESLAHRRKSVELEPTNEVVHGGLLWMLNYDVDADPRAVFNEHVAWAARHADPLMANAPGHADHDRSPDRRPLRIGYVSGDFRDHAAAYFIEPVLAHHNPAEVEVFCYTTSQKSDAVTDRLRPFARGGWRDITNLSDERAIEMIHADKIDILVDLAGHTKGNRLRIFARRPAPVQVTWIGYSNTTGMRAMDYWITDALLDPPGESESLAVEKQIRLPKTFACYRPPDDSPPVELTPPAAAKGYVTFASFNNVAKLNDRVVKLWSRALKSVPNSRLLIVGPSLKDSAVHADIYARFETLGVEKDRLEIRAAVPMREHLMSHVDVDIALDPFPFTGHTTTLHTLWMGVPVITLAGKSHVSRRGVSVMTNLGLEDWIAQSPDEYVEIAVRAAGDVKRLTALRRKIRERMLASPLMRADHFTRDLEEAYRRMWHSWCDSRDDSHGAILNERS